MNLAAVDHHPKISMKEVLIPSLRSRIKEISRGSRRKMRMMMMRKNKTLPDRIPGRIDSHRDNQCSNQMVSSLRSL